LTAVSSCSTAQALAAWLEGFGLVEGESWDDGRIFTFSNSTHALEVAIQDVQLVLSYYQHGPAAVDYGDPLEMEVADLFDPDSLQKIEKTLIAEIEKLKDVETERTLDAEVGKIKVMVDEFSEVHDLLRKQINEDDWTAKSREAERIEKLEMNNWLETAHQRILEEIK
tara:strand:+ start:9766 stop:10269 length:504 start_codon:yes stop_codon:yes gene_type:complete